jgi:peptidoglycan/xylan/chitin deacetylase (PgdA/CDA1 family)
MPAKALYITTSWDDGHPMDLKLAEILAKYGLPATFYVPMRNSREVMTQADVRGLSSVFEIGGHTVEHCDLRALSLPAARNEIRNCKTAIEQITSLPCRSFCFPKGRFCKAHLQQVSEAGFTLARTVELMSLDAPRRYRDLWLMPTTIQVVQAGFAAHFKNSIKRLRPANLVRYARVRKPGWLATLEALLELANRDGGVIHLWGHSWEIEQNSDWQNLDLAFALLAQYKGRATFLSNGEFSDSVAQEAASRRLLRSHSLI